MLPWSTGERRVLLIAQERGVGNSLDWEWLRACLTRRNDFWGFLYTGPLYIWVRLRQPFMWET